MGSLYFVLNEGLSQQWNTSRNAIGDGASMGEAEN